MRHSDPELEPVSKPSLVGRWILWVPALAIAFYLGSLSRNPLTSPSNSAAESTPVTAPLRAAANGDGGLQTSELAVVDLFRNASPSVVFITTVEPRRIGYTRVVTEAETGSGSGFIWDNEGRVVTNYHVIRSVWDLRRGQMMPSDQVRVTLADQSEWNAVVLGVAPEKDLAVLQVDAPREKLQPLSIGNSSDLMVGQSVYAIGNPFGLDQTLTTGVVSALNREIRSLDRQRIIRNVIQTDAAINPGNSGGPLLDSQGRLIGVNTQIASTSGSSAGIGFAIPVDTVTWVVPDLIEWGQIARPTLGLQGYEEQWLRKQGLRGVLVMGVTPNSGAERAGLRPTLLDRRNVIRELGDIIIGLGGQKVDNFDDLLRALEDREEGDQVKLLVRRNEREVELDVELGPSTARLAREGRR